MAFRCFYKPAMPLLAMLAIAVTVGCASTGEVPSLGREVALRPGERLALPDHAWLRYVAVTADSRCRPDVQCIHAGDADVAFEFGSRQGEARPISVNTVKSPNATIGKWQLRLLSLGFGDSPRATVKVETRAD